MKRASQISLFLFLFLVFAPPLVFSPASNLQKGYFVVTFDDGRTGALEYAASVLQQNGVKATMFTYVTSLSGGWVGFLNQSGMMDLQQHYSWEIQGHSHNHPDMDSLNSNQLQIEVSTSRQELLNDGFRPISIFAYPYSSGDTNATVRNPVRQNYYAARTAVLTNATAIIYGRDSQISSWCRSNCPPPDKYQLVGNALLNTTTVPVAESWIDQAVSQHMVVILVFHQIVRSNSDAYSYLDSDFAQLMGYARAKMDQGLLESLYMSEAVHTIFDTSASSPNNWPLYALFTSIPVLASTALLVARYKRSQGPDEGIQLAINELMAENKLDPTVISCPACDGTMSFDSRTFKWYCARCEKRDEHHQ